MLTQNEGTQTTARQVMLDELELVRRIAGQLARTLPRHVERDELVALGNLGLVEARARFDASRGVPFAAFAARRIRGAILDGLRKEDPLTRSERAEVRARVAPEPEARPTARAPQESDASEAWADDALAARAELARVLSAMNALPVREREIVRGHFINEHPLKHIAKALGVTESRISQILSVALRRLRSILAEQEPTAYNHLEVVQ